MKHKVWWIPELHRAREWEWAEMILKFVDHALCVHVGTNGCTRDHGMQTIEINCSRTLLDKLEWRTHLGICYNVSILLIASFLKGERQQASSFLRQKIYHLSQRKNTRDKHITSANVITIEASRDKHPFKNVNWRMNIYFHVTTHFLLWIKQWQCRMRMDFSVQLLILETAESITPGEVTSVVRETDLLPSVLSPGLEVNWATSTILTANCCPVSLLMHLLTTLKGPL